MQRVYRDPSPQTPRSITAKDVVCCRPRVPPPPICEEGRRRRHRRLSRALCAPLHRSNLQKVRAQVATPVTGLRRTRFPGDWFSAAAQRRAFNRSPRTCLPSMLFEWLITVGIRSAAPPPQFHRMSWRKFALPVTTQTPGASRKQQPGAQIILHGSGVLVVRQLTY